MVIEKTTELKFITFSPAGTDNLMDYPIDNSKRDKFFALAKWQWELLYKLLTKN